MAKAPPVESTGTSIVLRRLLENFTAEEVVVVGRAPSRDSLLSAPPLHYPVVKVPSLPVGIRGDRYWRLVETLPAFLTGRQAIRRYRPRVILAMFPDVSALLTGYWLHRGTGLPFLVYFCDLYMEDRQGGWEALLARRLQPLVFGSAVRILTGNEGMAEYYRRRYGLATICLPTCINVPVPEHSPLPPPGRPFVIGYSGNINATRLSSLRALVRAVGSDSSYEIRYFTPQTQRFLQELGLWAENARAAFVTDEAELRRRLSACDALFLPLTFDVKENSYDQLSTCFGTKAYEYLLSRRPVLLHCPSDYYIARFHREWACGMVVDDPTSGALGAALQKLRADGALRDSLVRNALRAARQFSGPRVAAVLRTTLDEVAPVSAWPRRSGT